MRLLFLTVLIVGCTSSQNVAPSQAIPEVPKLYDAPDWPEYGDLYVSAEQMPVLKGGLRMVLDQFIALRAKKKCRKGRILVQMVVDEGGKIIDVAVREGFENNCASEAVAVVRNAQFEPARQDGEPVKMVMSLPFTIR